MKRFFNTAGPIEPDRHYAVDPLSRLDMEEILQLIDQRKYFVLHAPRQTGKTSALLALVEKLNREGQYAAVYCNVEPAQVARNDTDIGIRSVLSELEDAVKVFLGDSRIEKWVAQAVASRPGVSALGNVLKTWCSQSNKPVILVIDEIDALVGDTLVSVLRQLRAGYPFRPKQFPQSVILCGVRDVRDYRIHTSKEGIVTGGSAFNVRSESLRLGNFSQEELAELYAQHTAETGQIFEEKALELAWYLTQGQPWLVNALGYEVTYKMEKFRDRSRPITAEALDEAKERIIQRRETHLDQLVDKLKEPRVRGVIAPLLAGEKSLSGAVPDDVEYVVDLGLIRPGQEQPEIANAIYREVIPRELTYMTQREFAAQFKPQRFVGADGRLQVPELLQAFQQFFRENSEHWLGRFDYQEAGPQLMMQAFLQRIVNGGGRIDREYGLGRGRTDLLLRWPTTDQGFSGPVQTAVIELKVLHASLEATIAAGLKQTGEYLDRVGPSEAHLVIFDRRPHVSWDDKIFVRQESCRGAALTVWGM